jgi:hypothetical protein
MLTRPNLPTLKLPIDELACSHHNCFMSLVLAADDELRPHLTLSLRGGNYSQLIKEQLLNFYNLSASRLRVVHWHNVNNLMHPTSLLCSCSTQGHVYRILIRIAGWNHEISRFIAG